MDLLALLLVSFSPLLSDVARVVTLATVAIAIWPRHNQPLKATGLLYAFFFLFGISLARDLLATSQGAPRALSAFVPMCFFVGFLVAQRYDFNTYLFRLERIALWISALSLLGVAVYQFMPALVWQLPIYEFEGTYHRTGILFNILVDGDAIVARNAGIAWEPGVLQFIVNLGLYASIRRTDGRVPVGRYLVFASALIATRSTIGLAIFAGLSILIAMRHRGYRWAFALAGVLLIRPIIEELQYQATWKLAGSSAFEGRWTPTINAFQMALEHPFGMGNIDYSAFAAHLGILSYDSFSQMAIRYGLPLMALVTACLVALSRTAWPLVIVVGATLTSESIWLAPILTPLYFYAVSSTTHTVHGAYFENSLGNQHTGLRPAPAA